MQRTGWLLGKVILIADDEAEIRRVLRNTFRHRGATVLEAENGRAAFALVLAQHIDVVLSDVRMPNGDGLELLEAIKRRNPDVPVVFMITAFEDQTEADALSKGAAKVFHKPFSLKSILVEVESAIFRTT